VLVNPLEFLADLDLTQSDSADPAVLGRNLTYTINVTNNGPLGTSEVTVTDTLPAGASFVSILPSQGSCNGPVSVTCSVGDLEPGESATVTIVVTPTSAGALSNTASVTSNRIDTNLANNSDTETTTITPQVFVGGVAATIVGTEGNDTISGVGGNDVIDGGPGSDVIKGGAGRDTLMGGSGNDKLNGGSGADRCKGGSGRDTARSCKRASGVP
jgi:uncharacterized repeat protein (TIGR01451 family)